MAARKDGWKYADFSNKMNSTDVDDHINALDALIAHLGPIESLSDIDENKKVISKVMYCLEDDPESIQLQRRLSSCLRAILLLSTRLPTENIKDFISPICDTILNKVTNVCSHLVSIIQEIFTLLMSCDPLKQKNYIKFIFPICVSALSSRSNEKITSSLRILSSLTESLGSLFTSQQNKELFDKIIELIEFSQLASTTNLVNLAQVWSFNATTEMNNNLIKILIDKTNRFETAFIILANLVIHSPYNFTSQINSLIGIFYPKIDILLQERGNDGEDDESTQHLTDAQLSIDAFNSLIKAFPASFKATADVYCQLSFDLFTYGVYAPSLDVDSSPNFEEDNDDDIFNDDDQNELNDDDPDPVNDDTWKIRKSINILAQTLIKKYPDTFMDTFLSEPSYQQSTVTFIVDTDPGAKTTSLLTLLLFAKTEQSKLDEKIVKSWIDAFKHEISDYNQKDSIVLYPALNQLLLLFKSYIPKYSQSIVEAIEQSKNPQQNQQVIIPHTLTLINTLIRYSQNVDNLAPSLCKILNRYLNQSKLCLSTISYFYYHSTNKSIKQLNDLNTQIINLAKNSQNSINVIEPLSIFVSMFDNRLDALSTILNLARNNKKQIMKAVNRAIVLISTSPHKDILKTKNNEIFSIINSTLNETDTSNLYYSLCAIYACLSCDIFDVKQRNSIVPSLIDFLKKNDDRISLISVLCLQKLSMLESVQKSFLSVVEVVLESKEYLPVELIKEMSEVLKPVPETQLNQLIDKLISKTSINIFIFIGFLTAQNKKLLNNSIQKLEKQVNSSGFIIQCIGEIGYRSSLSNYTSIIEKVFALVVCDDRLIFSNAAVSAGLISANENAFGFIFPQLVQKTINDPEHISTWLLAISKCLKRIQRNPFDKAKAFNYNQLFDYLVSKADYTKETELTFVECFASLLSISPSLSPLYFNQIKSANNASPLLSRALSEFVLNCDKASDVELILKNLISFLSTKNPLICYGVILAIKNSLRLKSLHKLISSNFNALCQCVEMTDNQLAEVYYGTVLQTVDLGQNMRTAAIDTIGQIFSQMPESIDLVHMINSLIKGLNDPITEIRSKALNVITKSCDDPEALKIVIKSVIPVLNNCKIDNTAYLMFIAKLKLCTENQKVYAVERLVAGLENQTLINNFREDFRIEQSQQQHQDENADYNVDYELLKKYNPNMAKFFINQ